MSTECVRLADQLRRAFVGDAWHGPPLSEVLAGITAEQAIAKPLPNAHNIFELVLHIDIYLGAAYAALNGVPLPKWYDTGADWLAVTVSEWTGTCETLFRNAEALAASVSQLADPRLDDTVPGRDYSFYILLHGIVQHSLYHAGQIAMLKRALTA